MAPQPIQRAPRRLAAVRRRPPAVLRTPAQIVFIPPIRRRPRLAPLRRRSSAAIRIASVAVFVPPIPQRRRAPVLRRRPALVSTPPVAVVVVTTTFVPPVVSQHRRALAPRRRGQPRIPVAAVVHTPEIARPRRNLLFRSRRGKVAVTTTIIIPVAVFGVDSGHGLDSAAVAAAIAATDAGTSLELVIFPIRVTRKQATALSTLGKRMAAGQAAKEAAQEHGGLQSE